VGFFVVIVPDTLADNPWSLLFLLFLIESLAELSILIIHECQFQILDALKPFTLAGF
jgi:hypothetical protein